MTLILSSIGTIGAAPPAAATVAAARKDATSFVLAWAGLGLESYNPYVALIDKDTATLSKKTSIFPSSGSSSKYVYGIDILDAANSKYFVGCSSWRAVIQELAGSFDFTDSTEGRAGASGIPACLSTSRVLVVDENSVDLLGVSAFTVTTLDSYSWPTALLSYHASTPTFDIATVDSTKALIAYVETAGDFKAIVVSNSSDTVAAGTPATIESGASWESIQLARDNNGNFVLYYQNGADYTLKLLSISGTTVSVLGTKSGTWSGTPYYGGNMALWEDHGAIFHIAGAPLSLSAKQFYTNTSSINVTGCEDNALITGSYYNTYALAMGSLDFVTIQNGDTSHTFNYPELIDTSLTDAFCGAATPARFYFALTGQALTEKFSLPFAGVRPEGMTLNRSLGTVVLGSDAPSNEPVVYSTYPYPTGTASYSGFPTGTAIQSLKWV